MPLRSARRPKVSTASASGTVQIWVGARSHRLWRRPLMLVLVSIGLSGGLLLLGLSFRLGLRLMLDPAALPQALARLTRSQPEALPPAISLEELRHQAEASQQQVGEPLRLELPRAKDREVLLVPVLEAGAIASLHLFASEGGGEEPRAIATLPIAALPKDTVLAPWLSSPQAPKAVPADFDFTRVVPLPAPPVATDGLWLTLEGSWQQQGLTLRYGQLLHVDPQAQRLELLTPWSSPANRPPQWADLDGDGPSDLVIDETVGLEPTLRGLQVMPGPRVQSVSWVRVPVDAGAQAGDYQQALRLARGGLWHPAQTQLANLKTVLSQGWNPAAEAQLRLMDRHRAITRQQAEQDWSTPTQHILALLIDGRWEPALTRLEDSPELLPTLLNRLGVDQGRLWNRISAAAALPDPPPAVYVWGGLALKAQQNQPTNRDGATPDWLNRQPVPAAARQRLAKVLATLNTTQAQAVASAKAGATVAIAAETASAQTTGAIAAPITALIGQAQPIPAPQAGYAAPGQSLDAALGQWYAIDVQAVNQSQTWQRGTGSIPAGATPAAVWPVVQTAAQASPHLLRWVSPTTGVSAPLTVRGLSLTNGTVTLLATGPATNTSALPPLVFSQGALMWLDADQGQPAEPGAIAATATTIFGDQPVPTDFTAALTNLTQHSIDLTGDGQPERVLTWNDAALTQLKNWRVQVETTSPKTIVLNADNRVLYSDMFATQTVVALTNPALGEPAGLLVHQAGRYELLSWQTASQQFE
ncbi:MULTISPECIES: hypothetical protein [Cyanophyceae]|uniref:hypothetical protein n=1 Tax=Cyanophyceae TaxID=3028117 RepID=UPI00168A36F9|nr:MULTISPECIES: hypothetical protein [Cyanophyceae]MBD1918044.1 hypothetical protein [Phormidium sp. FACHB-77]MBD2030077.1 hypothetical protein [Phormidium sp. FACHB-322]MBD2051552.1 hypothetical protein [Leptolyngbya sp. FACHB-60]